MNLKSILLGLAALIAQILPQDKKAAERILELEAICYEKFGMGYPGSPEYNKVVQYENGKEYSTQNGVNKAGKLEDFIRREYGQLGQVNSDLVSLAVQIAGTQDAIFKFSKAREERTVEPAYKACARVIEAHFDALRNPAKADNIIQSAKEDLNNSLAERQKALQSLFGNRYLNKLDLDEQAGEILRLLSISVNSPIVSHDIKSDEDRVLIRGQVNANKVEAIAWTISEINASLGMSTWMQVPEENKADTSNIEIHIYAKDFVKLPQLLDSLHEYARDTTKVLKPAAIAAVTADIASEEQPHLATAPVKA